MLSYQARGMRGPFVTGAVIKPIAAALAILAASGGSALGQAPATAPAFPAKPVTLIIPFAPGGPVDIEARRHATRLTDILGQPVLLDYKPGAGETIGTHYVAKRSEEHTSELVTSRSRMPSSA